MGSHSLANSRYVALKTPAWAWSPHSPNQNSVRLEWYDRTPWGQEPVSEGEGLALVIEGGFSLELHHGCRQEWRCWKQRNAKRFDPIHIYVLECPSANARLWLNRNETSNRGLRITFMLKLYYTINSLQHVLIGRFVMWNGASCVTALGKRNPDSVDIRIKHDYTNSQLSRFDEKWQHSSHL